MPWRELTIDNCKDVSGKGGHRQDKALIMLYESDHLTFRITARHHDGHFKYYLDCEKADLYERWFGVPGVESRVSIRHRAIHIIEGLLSRSDLMAFVELRTAENDISTMAA